MTPEQYRQHDATALAELVRSKQVAPRELLAAALTRLEATEPTLNALHRRLDDAALVTANGPLTGPFAGVPFLVKDIAQDMEGLPTGSGNAFLKTILVKEDSEFVRRCRRAGLVIFGKTATPEFALKGVTEPDAFGATRNPINPEHTPGGSSGGSAAMVAAAVVPMAGASDGGGSIRIPAGYCGLFGLRPSRGRVPCGPHVGEVWEGASSEHVLTRSVRDSAAMLDVLAGPLSGDPFQVKAATGRFAALAQEPPRPLRIAFCTRSPIGGSVHPDVLKMMAATVKTLSDLGHHLEEAEPKVDGMALARSFMTLYLGQVAANVRDARKLGANTGHFELDTLALDLLGRAIDAGEYVQQHRRWNDYARGLGGFFQQYDLYLIPTAAEPAPKIGALTTPAWQHALMKPLRTLNLGKALLKSGVVEQMIHNNLRVTPFTQLSNLTGTPSMSCPMGLSATGLPLGAQFVAPYGEEGRLLALATQLEPHFMRGKLAL